MKYFSLNEIADCCEELKKADIYAITRENVCNHHQFKVYPERQKYLNFLISSGGHSFDTSAAVGFGFFRNFGGIFGVLLRFLLFAQFFRFTSELMYNKSDIFYLEWAMGPGPHRVGPGPHDSWGPGPTLFCRGARDPLSLSLMTRASAQRATASSAFFVFITSWLNEGE